MAHVKIKKWLAITATAALALLAIPPTAGAATESLSVNLAATAGPMTGVGEGFLYGLSQDGSAPGDNYLRPLNPTLMRGGGARIAGDGWIGDGYRPGAGYQARITSIVDQAERVTRAPYHAEYVLMLSDLWGADLTPQTVYSGDVPVSNGAVTVPLTLGDSHGAYVMFLTPPGSATADTTTDDTATSGTDHFAYDASWGTATGVADLHNGTAHWSSTAGGTATYTFTGGNVTIWGVKDHDQGIAGFSVDGGPVTHADDYATTRTAQAPLFSSSGLGAGTHTVTISNTGTKNSASAADTVALDYATVTPSAATADDGTTAGTTHFTYGSNWGTAAGVGDLYAGTAHWNNTAGSTATLSFSGTGAAVYGVKDVDQGIATYSVDGGTAHSVDDYSATRVPGASLFAVAGLASGNHTITITVAGTKNGASTNDTVALDSATAF